MTDGRIGKYFKTFRHMCSAVIIKNIVATRKKAYFQVEAHLFFNTD